MPLRPRDAENYSLRRYEVLAHFTDEGSEAPKSLVTGLDRASVDPVAV